MKRKWWWDVLIIAMFPMFAALVVIELTLMCILYGVSALTDWFETNYNELGMR